MSIKWFELGPEEREETAKKLAKALRREERVALAFLFGSYLEGVFRDVDVAVYLTGEANLLDAAAYAEELTSHLTTLASLPCGRGCAKLRPNLAPDEGLNRQRAGVKDEVLYAALWANALDEELGLAALSK